MSETEYEPEENSFAKNVAYDAIEESLEDQGLNLEDVDLIEVADAVVEALLAAGVSIPENLKNPHKS